MNAIMRFSSGILAVLAGALVTGQASDTAAPEPEAASSPTTPASEAKGPAQGIQPQLARSYEVEQVAKLADAGVPESVIRAYVDGSRAVTTPRSDEVIFLSEHKVPGNVIVAMMNRGTELQNAASQAAPVQPPAPSPAQDQAASAAAAPVAPPPVVVTAPPQEVAYAQPVTTAPYVYPTYGYADYGVYSYAWPSIWLGYGWGCYPSYYYHGGGWHHGYYGPPNHYGGGYGGAHHPGWSGGGGRPVGGAPIHAGGFSGRSGGFGGHAGGFAGRGGGGGFTGRGGGGGGFAGRGGGGGGGRR